MSRLDSTRLGARALLAGAALLGCLVGAPAPAEAQRRIRRVRSAPTPTKKPEEKKPEKKKKPDRYFAVHAGWVHTVTEGTLRDVTILAKNGKILRIGRDLVLPKKTEVLDAKDKHVYPGLIAHNSYGVVGFSPADSTDVYGLNMVLALSQGITSVGAGGYIAKLTYGTLEGHVLGQKVREFPLSYRSARSKKRTRQGFEKVRAWLREARQLKLRARRGEKVKPPRPLSGSLASYYKLMTGQMRAKVRLTRAKDIREIAHLAIKYNFRVTLEGATEAHLVAPLISRAGFRVLLAPRDRGYGWGGPSRNSPKWTIENAAILHKHGVPVTLTCQSVGIGLWGLAGQDLFTLPLEAGFAIRGGLPEAEGLKGLTINAAKLLGVDDQVGSIEVGKDCDLAIAGGDLLHYQVLPEWTVVNGRIAYDKAKDSLLRHIRPRDLQQGNLKIPQLWPRRVGAPQPKMPKSEQE